MKFTLIDGNPLTGRAPARPRHWAIALVILIVAQWLLGNLTDLGRITAGLLLPSGILGMFGTFDTTTPFAALAIELFSFGLLAALAIALSRKLDARDMRSLGISPLATFEAMPWLIAGLLVALPTLASFGSLSSGWVEMAASALLLIAPVTLVQAGAEEIIFRGILLASLAARYGAVRGIFISAALFALWHLYVGQPAVDIVFKASTTFVFGATAALLALHQGHLGGAIALHFVWNIAAHLAGGFEGWPDDFWQSFMANSSVSIESFDNPIVRLTVLSLLIETFLILAVTRMTFHRLFGLAKTEER
jgi:uncharacterized protein